MARREGITLTPEMHFNPCANDDWVFRLCSAIMRQAVIDFQAENEAGKANLKRFFRSEWGQLLSFDNGGLIIETLEKEDCHIHYAHREVK